MAGSNIVEAKPSGDADSGGDEMEEGFRLGRARAIGLQSPLAEVSLPFHKALPRACCV